MLRWLVRLFCAWLGFRADRAEHVGEIKRENADLKAEITELRKEDDAVRDLPHGKAAIIEALKHGDL